MSHLCRLRTKTHGEDGQWAYDEITTLRQRVAELERFHELDTRQIAYLFEERGAMKQQRDELLAALEYAASCLRTDGNDPIDLVIASVKEKS